LQKSSKRPRQTVLIVDDDVSVLRALARRVRADGFKVLTYDRPTLLLASDIPKSNACLVLDVNLPEMDGVELYETLVAAGCHLPVIMITGRNDLRSRRLVERVNAVGLLIKPFEDSTFLQIISRAISLSA
jgi:two-component system response regulator FixJ